MPTAYPGDRLGEHVVTVSIVPIERVSLPRHNYAGRWIAIDLDDLRRFVKHGTEEDHWFGSGWMDFTWAEEMALVHAGWAQRGLSGGLWATEALRTVLAQRDDRRD